MIPLTQLKSEALSHTLVFSPPVAIGMEYSAPSESNSEEFACSSVGMASSEFKE